jgi:peptidoglycan/LPS O-acetylase OafA/YrhL
MFEGKQIVVQGFEIPSDSPVFLTILSIHILAGLLCVITGAIAMLSKKQPGTHPKSGNIFYIGLWVIFITASVIAFARWKEDYYLFFLGLVSFISAFIGRKALKEKWQKWSIWHITGMGISYIFLLIAFYVDNAKFLPVWKDLPPIIYWLLPLLIGVPIIIRTLLNHPLSRNYFKRLTGD